MTIGHAATRALHALRWCVAAVLSMALMSGTLVFLAGRGARDMVDSRAFWVTWVRTSGLVEAIRGGVDSGIGALEAPAVGVLGSDAPEAAAAVHEALEHVRVSGG